MEFEVSYTFENEQQFWDGKQQITWLRLDGTLRASLNYGLTNRLRAR